MTSGAWIVVGAAVGALGAILGGAVERSSRSHSEFVAAAAAWMAATEAVSIAATMDATFSQGPSNQAGMLLDWLVEQIEATLGKGRVELMRALVHRPLIRRLETIADRVFQTTALLVLRAPLGLLREIQPHLEVLDAWLRSTGDADLKLRWEREARPAVLRALRRYSRPRWRRLLRVS